MRKIHSLLAAACLLAASCNKEEIQSETDKAGMYHITVAVTGSSFQPFRPAPTVLMPFSLP